MKRDILIKWFYPHPPERVWECLTDPELISQWLMKNNFKAEVGHKFEFKSKPLPKMGFDGTVYAEVTEVDPPHKLSYTWKGGPRPGVINLDSIVIWTLVEKNNGTELTLEHKGFKGWKNFIASVVMEQGWKKGIAKRFQKILNEYAKDK